MQQAGREAVTIAMVTAGATCNVSAVGRGLAAVTVLTVRSLAAHWHRQDSQSPAMF